MAYNTAIDRIFDEAESVVKLLAQSDETSLQIAVGDHLRKSLLLAAASYFEYRVCQSVIDFIREHSGKSEVIVEFVRNKAISRQYHSWFQWEANNANHFFGLFGSSFKSSMSKRVSDSESLRLSIRSFLEIGNERNRLVHQDYATFQLEKTLEEIYTLYKQSMEFIEYLPLALRDNSNLTKTD